MFIRSNAHNDLRLRNVASITGACKFYDCMLRGLEEMECFLSKLYFKLFLPPRKKKKKQTNKTKKLKR